MALDSTIATLDREILICLHKINAPKILTNHSRNLSEEDISHLRYCAYRCSGKKHPDSRCNPAYMEKFRGNGHD